MDQAAPIAKIEDLANYDAIIVGTGTRFGRMASQMANFLDQAGGLWAKGALHGKVGGAFTSTGTQHGGQEQTLFSVITNLLHFGLTIVGLDYGHQGQMGVDEVVGGAPYGATTVAGGGSCGPPSGIGSQAYLSQTQIEIPPPPYNTLARTDVAATNLQDYVCQLPPTASGF